MKKKFKFIDLFAGIGGFHQALSNLGGECVFASEIDSFAIETYKQNYGIDSGINIRDVDVKDITKHDVLCAAATLPMRVGNVNGVETHWLHSHSLN